MLWRTVRLLSVCAVLAVGGAAACGGNASDANSSSQSSAGSGGRAGSASGGKSSTAGAASDLLPVTCGDQSCAAVVIPIQSFVIPACCAGEGKSQCGLDSSVLAAFGPTFTDACQPLAQPGSADASCPDSAKTLVQGTGFEIGFPGCCRANHTCGYQLDTIAGALRLGLGCVDAAPFLDGGTPQACGEAGAASDSGGAGAGG